MGKKDVYYSYDVDTGEIVSKTRFNDDGTIDKWDGINKPEHGHNKYSSSSEFAKQEEGDVYKRKIGENKDKRWEDRDGVNNRI